MCSLKVLNKQFCWNNNNSKERFEIGWARHIYKNGCLDAHSQVPGEAKAEEKENNNDQIEDQRLPVPPRKPSKSCFSPANVPEGTNSTSL